MLFGFVFTVFGIGGVYRFNKGSGISGFKGGVLRLFESGLMYF